MQGDVASRLPMSALLPIYVIAASLSAALAIRVLTGFFGATMGAPPWR